MKKFLKKLRDRKGITMTEVIVAMAVVILVTGSAISLLMSSVQFDTKYNAQTADLNACESAVHCVRFTKDPAKLDTYLKLLGFEGHSVSETEVDFKLPNGNVTVKVTSEGGTIRSAVVTFGEDVIYESKN